MIHLLYSYLIVNSFLVGIGFEDFKNDYDKSPIIFCFVLLTGFLIGLPFCILFFGFLWIKESGLGSIISNNIYYFKVVLGYKKLDDDSIDVLKQAVNFKLKKEKKDFKDKHFIKLGTKIINHIENKNVK